MILSEGNRNLKIENGGREIVKERECREGKEWAQKRNIKKK